MDADLWRNVGALAAYGVAKGYPDGGFGPVGDVLHAQTISFIARALVARGLWRPQPDNPAPYPNLPTTADHRRDPRGHARGIQGPGPVGHARLVCPRALAGLLELLRHQPSALAPGESDARPGCCAVGQEWGRMSCRKSPRAAARPT